MNKIFSGIALISILLLSLTGCETDNTSLLSDGVWTFENLTTDSEDETIQGWVLIGKAFLVDATLEFNSDMTFILDAPIADEPQTGTWSLVGDDVLTMNTDGGVPSTSNIQTLSKKELKFIETFTDENLETYNTTTTWIRD